MIATEPVHRTQTASTVTIVAQTMEHQPIVAAAQTPVNGGRTASVTMEAQEVNSTARRAPIVRIAETAAQPAILVGVAAIPAGTQVSWPHFNLLDSIVPFCTEGRALVTGDGECDDGSRGGAQYCAANTDCDDCGNCCDVGSGNIEDCGTNTCRCACLPTYPHMVLACSHHKMFKLHPHNAFCLFVRRWRPRV